jgi:hypothetical protein
VVHPHAFASPSYTMIPLPVCTPVTHCKDPRPTPRASLRPPQVFKDLLTNEEYYSDAKTLEDVRDAAGVLLGRGEGKGEGGCRVWVSG